MKLTRMKSPPSHWQRLKYHEFSELTEFGVGIDLEEIITNMAQVGYRKFEPVVVYEGKILDGRHKHSCACKAEVEPTFVEFVGTQNEALEFVASKVMRQHLDTGQRAMAASKMATLKDGQRKSPSSKDEGELGGSKSRKQAGKAMNVSMASVDRAKVVQEKCIPGIQRAVRMNEVSLTDAAEVANESPKWQEKALDAFRLGKSKTLKGALKRKKAKPKSTGREDLKDKTGMSLPSRCRDAFADQTLPDLVGELESVEAMMSTDGWMKRAGKLVDHYPFLLLAHFNDHLLDAQRSLQLALESLRAAVPHAVCPRCKGAPVNGSVCSSCRGCGHVPEHRYQEIQSGSL